MFACLPVHSSVSQYVYLSLYQSIHPSVSHVIQILSFGPLLNACLMKLHSSGLAQTPNLHYSCSTIHVRLASHVFCFITQKKHQFCLQFFCGKYLYFIPSEQFPEKYCMWHYFCCHANIAVTVMPFMSSRMAYIRQGTTVAKTLPTLQN